MIIVMAGLPASGKSALCRILASRLNGVVLDKDNLRSAIFSPADIEYSTAQDDFCMRLLMQAAEYLLSKNASRFIFLDGRPFSQTCQIDEVIRLANGLDQRWQIVECVCLEETAKKRLESQSASGEHSAANRDFTLYSRVKSGFQQISLPKIVIDTDQPLADCVDQALAAISRAV